MHAARIMNIDIDITHIYGHEHLDSTRNESDTSHVREPVSASITAYSLAYALLIASLPPSSNDHYCHTDRCDNNSTGMNEMKPVNFYPMIHLKDNSLKCRQLFWFVYILCKSATGSWHWAKKSCQITRHLQRNSRIDTWKKLRTASSVAVCPVTCSRIDLSVRSQAESQLAQYAVERWIKLQLCGVMAFVSFHVEKRTTFWRGASFRPTLVDTCRCSRWHLNYNGRKAVAFSRETPTNRTISPTRWNA